MEYIVLGILLYKSMTIYDLNIAFKKGLFLIYSASYGSLQNAVKKLLRNEYISFTEKVSNGRNKKIYSITPSGKEYFFEWMHSETEENKLEINVLSKIYFLGFIENRNEKLEIVDDMISKTEKVCGELSRYYDSLKLMKQREENKELAKYSIKTLDYGIMSHKAAIEWLYELKDEIENGL